MEMTKEIQEGAEIILSRGLVNHLAIAIILGAAIILFGLAFAAIMYKENKNDA